MIELPRVYLYRSSIYNVGEGRGGGGVKRGEGRGGGRGKGVLRGLQKMMMIIMMTMYNNDRGVC